MKNYFKIPILTRNDFDYFHIYIYFFPEINTPENNERYEFDHSEKIGISAPTEITYSNSSYNNDELYFYSITFKILGFGFVIKKQWGY